MKRIALLACLMALLVTFSAFAAELDYKTLTPQDYRDRLKDVTLQGGDIFYVLFDDQNKDSAHLLIAETDGDGGGYLYYLKGNDGIAFEDYSKTGFDNILFACSVSNVDFFVEMVPYVIKAIDPQYSYAQAKNVFIETVNNAKTEIIKNGIGYTCVVGETQYFFNVDISARLK